MKRTTERINEMYKEYPAVISLYNMVIENGNKSGFSYISSTIVEYNTTLNKLEKSDSVKFKKYVSALIKKDYIHRIDDDCKSLSNIEKCYLKNYLFAKYRNFNRGI